MLDELAGKVIGELVPRREPVIEPLRMFTATVLALDPKSINWRSTKLSESSVGVKDCPKGGWVSPTELSVVPVDCWS